MHPTRNINTFSSQLWIIPIPLHNIVPPSQQFTCFSQSNYLIIFIHNFYLHMRENSSYCCYLLFDRVICFGKRNYRACFSHSISNDHLIAVHFLDNATHNFYGTRRPRHNASSQRGKVKFHKFWVA